MTAAGEAATWRAVTLAARASALVAVEPNIRAMAKPNQAFLGRAARFLVGEACIRQFLDIGSCIPTEQNVHQVAQQAAPGSRVVYVDHDDVAVGHSRLILDGDPAVESV
jgi:S-adenosyl methyltransferase